MRLQTPFEEKLNAYTHGLGAILGVFALCLLVFSNTNKTPYALPSVVVYGVSIVILFTASTLYHAIHNRRYKHYFRVLDHISIYLLIAGTYTPVTLIALSHSKGWVLFYAVWIIALVGTVLKIFFTGKLGWFSTLLYLVMGWLIVFDFANLSQAIGPNGVLLLFGGGLFYTAGIIFYAIERIPYNHVIWHVFVLAGAICHFFMAYCYVV
ncbi:PAQR family membrane homeostasis protein TrhA [Cognatitamlana onchidii]|uniref:PAQR family membrane homeostasis protein TrhA n=1 Tax=Cognatitamlana onchidii TaxID=2562860 RepID=UPI0010A609BB|nr:hemolysin III family protein [Algibacter onchidii]